MHADIHDMYTDNLSPQSVIFFRFTLHRTAIFLKVLPIPQSSGMNKIRELSLLLIIKHSLAIVIHAIQTKIQCLIVSSSGHFLFF